MGFILIVKTACLWKGSKYNASNGLIVCQLYISFSL